jgi:uncharacterized protein YlxP (DUF503 family)
MAVGILVLDLELTGCHSLKEKRSRISPIIHRLQEQFNISISETAHLDAWQRTEISCALVANDRKFIEKSLHEVVRYLESHWPDETLRHETLEII